MLRVGIAGATGYTGVELLRLLNVHPECRVVLGTSRRYQGRRLNELFPHLGAAGELELVDLDAQRVADAVDVVFLALPHGVAGDFVARLPATLPVIDLGADFRLTNPDDYRQWYGAEPPPEPLRARAVYGLPELFRPTIRGATLVANPGCFVTASTLAAAPLLAADLIDPSSLIFDAVSGVSGAGRGLKLGAHFGEVNENFTAYNIAGAHRHTPEIEQNLSRVAGEAITVTFTPHLAPMTRGILTTAYARPRDRLTTDTAIDCLVDYYRDEPFIRVRTGGELPQTKEVWGSNRCDLTARVDERTGRVILVSAIDNLVKGASGQAVQNLNILHELPETTGLTALPTFP